MRSRGCLPLSFPSAGRPVARVCLEYLSAARPLDTWPQEHVDVLGKAQLGAAGVAGGRAAKVACEFPRREEGRESAEGEEAQRESPGYRRHTTRQ